jgi:HEAT repeat protein
LVNAVKSYDNAGIRRDTLDALRARTANPAVRAALLYTLEHDRNVGNRLAALDAVRGMEGGNDLERSLLQVLEHDNNMGVRVESVDAVVDHFEKAGRDDAVLNALQRLARNDPSCYVRLKCASALRKLGNDGFLQADEK